MRRKPSVLRHRPRRNGADYVGGTSNGHAFGHFTPGHAAAREEVLRAAERPSVTYVSNKRSDLSNGGDSC
jgi:hypothetical protein